MIKKSFLTIASFFILTGVIHSQETSKHYPSIAIGGGMLSFKGDINSKPYSRRVGYNITIEQRIGKHFAISINGLFGKLAGNQSGPINNLNFESKITQSDLNLLYHFGNDTSKFAPYLSAGLGYLLFDPHADLKDAKGNNYNYWQDGSIHNVPETPTNTANSNASVIKRDHTYETQLKDSIANYKRSTLALPIGAGLNIRLMEKLHLKIGITYYITFSDWIDNYKTGANDKYIYTNAALQITFGKRNKTDINMNDNIRNAAAFSEIDKSDSDKDGVLDTDDKCPGTPSEAKVNASGCPIDSDGDGVPDYLDKEPNTKKGAIVNDKGITQTEEMIAARKEQFDAMASQRLNEFIANPNDAANAKKQNSGKVIPNELRSADKNNDGIISPDEISKAIDSFFDGDSDFTVEKLNDLIDLFFEQ